MVNNINGLHRSVQRSRDLLQRIEPYSGYDMC